MNKIKKIVSFFFLILLSLFLLSCSVDIPPIDDSNITEKEDADKNKEDNKENVDIETDLSAINELIANAYAESKVIFDGLDTESKVTNNIGFYNPIYDNISYAWNSLNKDVLEDDGTIHRQDKDVKVTLCLYIFYHDEKIDVNKSFEYSLIIKAKEQVLTEEYTYDVKGTKSILKVSELNEVSEDGKYNKYLDVVSYIYHFHKLPSNFYTKEEAKALGWKGSGNVWVNDKLKGANIGGDTFYNKEEILPIYANYVYIEVDCDYTDGSRGSHRIVYNKQTWDIYYTDDHYNSFKYMIGVLDESN